MGNIGPYRGPTSLILIAAALAAIALTSPVAIEAEGKTNPFAGVDDAVRAGEGVFNDMCAECHGDGRGGSGPDLTDGRWIYGGSDAEVFATISGGRPGGMPSFEGDLGETERWQVITYIRHLSAKYAK